MAASRKSKLIHGHPETSFKIHRRSKAAIALPPNCASKLLLLHISRISVVADMAPNLQRTSVRLHRKPARPYFGFRERGDFTYDRNRAREHRRSFASGSQFPCSFPSVRCLLLTFLINV